MYFVSSPQHCSRYHRCTCTVFLRNRHLRFHHTLQDTTLKSFNDVLPPIGVKVSAPEAGHPADSQWLVSDGRSLFRFTDGMVRLLFRGR